MRIIGGEHRGRRLQSPKGKEVRPTSDKMRAAIFNLLEHHPKIAASPFTIEGSTVADICCGTGALALEALSRGAMFAYCIDSSNQSLHCALQNAQHLGEAERLKIMKRSASRLSKAPEPCQLIFLDPPYPANLWTASLRSLAQQGWVEDGTIIIMESDSAQDAPRLPQGYYIWDERTYGAARLTMLCHSVNKALTAQ